MKAGLPCPVCASHHQDEVLDLGDIPLFCHQLCEEPERAREVPQGRMRLVQCLSCGLLFNADFQAERLEYQAAYDNAQHFSPRFSAFLDERARDLGRRFGRPGGLVVEVGCGDGVFLDRLCRDSGSRGLGIDPAAPTESPSSAITLVRGSLSEGEAWEADLVCLRHVLEHVPDPVPFLRALRRRSQGRPVLYCEVPNGEWMLSGAGFFDLLYEHVLYFTAATLSEVLRRAGWAPGPVESCFEGQFLAVEAVATPLGPVADGPPVHDLPPLPAKEKARVASFAADCRRLVDQTRHRLVQASSQGRSQALWGAGTKGIRLLQHLSDHAGALRVVDLNPRKHGRYLAGTGHVIEAPEALVDRPVDEVLITNPAYRPEIQSWLRDHGLDGDVRVLAPEPGQSP